MKVFFLTDLRYSFEGEHNTFESQISALSLKKTDWVFGLSDTCQNAPELKLSPFRLLDFLIKRISKLPYKFREELIRENIVSFQNPCQIWPKWFFGGNRKKLIKASQENLDRFILHFGKPDMLYSQGISNAHKARSLSRSNNIPYVQSVTTESLTPSTLSKSIICLKQALLVIADRNHPLIQTSGLEDILISNLLDEQFRVISQKLKVK